MWLGGGRGAVTLDSVGAGGGGVLQPWGAGAVELGRAQRALTSAQTQLGEVRLGVDGAGPTGRASAEAENRRLLWTRAGWLHASSLLEETRASCRALTQAQLDSPHALPLLVGALRNCSAVAWDEMVSTCQLVWQRLVRQVSKHTHAPADAW